MSAKYALIIANTDYTDPGLAKLSAPGKDAKDFARVLKSQDICGFDDVNVLLNQPEPVVRDTIDAFFDQKKPDDLLVLYFSGHGVRDEQGALYLAVKNTNRFRLRATAIKSDFIRESMDQSRSKRQVLILDCCNSGAFAQGTKAVTGGSVGTATAFEGTGYGHVVLTASDATQFAWEGDKIIGETQNSLFTHFLVKGLEGEADNDGDGRITINELYDYAYEQIVRLTPKQTPSKWSYKEQGEITLRESTRMENIRSVPLPSDLIDEIDDTRPYVREAAVQKLEKILKGRNIGLARSAREALEKIIEDDNTTRHVAHMATQVLDSIRPMEQEADEERKAREEVEKSMPVKAERRVAEKDTLQRAKAQEVIKNKSVKEDRKPAKSSWLPLEIAGIVIVAIVLTGFAGYKFLQALRGGGTAPTAASTQVATQSVSIPAGQAPNCTQASVFCVGLVADVGKVDDKSFNQSAWEALQKAKTEGNADWIQYIETTDSKDYAKNISTFADAGYKVIVTSGFNLTDPTYAAAKQYPKIFFIGTDQFLSKDANHPDWPLANLVGVVYNEDQSGFLVGALGAMMSKSHKIGAVCGTDAIPPVWRYGEGYKAGAAYEDAKNGFKTEVTVVYHSDVGFDKTFTDPTWGADTANSMIDKGADAIFGCGGMTGNGAVDAAAQRGVYGIGVDTDQYATLPEADAHLLTSAMKPIQVPVSDMIKAAKDGKFPTTGLYFGPAGYAPYHDLASQVPANVDTEMQALLKGLVDGSIKTNVPPVKPAQ